VIVILSYVPEQEYDRALGISMPSNQFSPLSRAVYKMAMRKSTVAQWYLQEAENCFLKRLFGLCWSVPEFYPKYLKKT